MPAEEAPAIRTANRRYGWRLGTAIATYSAVLVVVIIVINADVVTGPPRFVVATLPMLPVLGVPYAMVRWLRDTDELQRRTALESLAMGFAAGSVLTFGYGFWQLVGAPDLSWFLVWPVYAVCWAVAASINQRRYRLED